MECEAIDLLSTTSLWINRPTISCAEHAGFQRCLLGGRFSHTKANLRDARQKKKCCLVNGNYQYHRNQNTQKEQEIR